MSEISLGQTTFVEAARGRLTQIFYQATLLCGLPVLEPAKKMQADWMCIYPPNKLFQEIPDEVFHNKSPMGKAFTDGYAMPESLKETDSAIQYCHAQAKAYLDLSSESTFESTFFSAWNTLEKMRLLEEGREKKPSEIGKAIWSLLLSAARLQEVLTKKHKNALEERKKEGFIQPNELPACDAVIDMRKAEVDFYSQLARYYAQESKQLQHATYSYFSNDKSRMKDRDPRDLVQLCENMMGARNKARQGHRALFSRFSTFSLKRSSSSEPPDPPKSLESFQKSPRQLSSPPRRTSSSSRLQAAKKDAAIAAGTASRVLRDRDFPRDNRSTISSRPPHLPSSSPVQETHRPARDEQAKKNRGS